MGGFGEKLLPLPTNWIQPETLSSGNKRILHKCAGLTVISLLGAFMSEVNTAASELGVQGIANFDIMNPTVFFDL